VHVVDKFFNQEQQPAIDFSFVIGLCFVAGHFCWAPFEAMVRASGSSLSLSLSLFLHAINT